MYLRCINIHNKLIHGSHSSQWHMNRYSKLKAQIYRDEQEDFYTGSATFLHPLPASLTSVNRLINHIGDSTKITQNIYNHTLVFTSIHPQTSST